MENKYFIEIVTIQGTQEDNKKDPFKEGKNYPLINSKIRHHGFFDDYSILYDFKKLNFNNYSAKISENVNLFFKIYDDKKTKKFEEEYFTPANIKSEKNEKRLIKWVSISTIVIGACTLISTFFTIFEIFF